MPGTILVSVLELNGLPLPSPPSSVSMKVSMGKREYQAGEKGDFSFPLTTLRENLVIVIHDSEGNEISHGGVETKSIVERGLWDNIFSLEGGGQVHMKLQFVLNEDEKNRIRKMREAALKRKLGRPIDFRANRVQVAANAGIKLSSSVFLESTVSGGVNSFPENPGLTTVTKIDKVEERRSSSEKKLDIHLSRGDPSMESVREVKARPISSPTPSKPVSAVTSAEKLDFQPRRADPPMESVQKVEARLLSSPTPSKSVHSKQSLSLTNGPPSKKRPSLERSPSSVKRMITAFESSRFQDNRPQTKATLEKQQLSKVGVYSKEKEKESKESMESRATGVRENPPIDTSSTSENLIHRRDEQSDDASSEPVKTQLVRRTLTHKSSETDNLREQVTDINAEEVEKEDSKPCEDFIVNPPIETSSASEISLCRHDKKSDNNSSEFSKKLITRRMSTHESRRADTCNEKESDIILQKLDTSLASDNSLQQHDKHYDVLSSEPLKSSIMTRTSIHESRKIDTLREYRVNGFEVSGTLRFPDQQRLFCGATGVESERHQEKMITSLPQEIGDVSGNQNKTKSESETPKPERDEGSEPSTCIFGKVMKVAIMAGFGMLVIFTRRRNSRR